MQFEAEAIAPFDPSALRGKYILVCRTSGVHRLPSYYRLTSTGPWKPKDKLTPEDVLPHHMAWAGTSLPLPYQNQHPEQHQEGYGAKLIFIHATRMPWAEPVATDWIFSDCASDIDTWSTVQQWISHQTHLREEFHEKGLAIPSGEVFHEDFHGFDACISFDEFSISTCAYICEQLETVSTPQKTIDTIRNKLYLRQICEQIGIPVPRSLTFRLSDLFSGRLDRLFLSPNCPNRSTTTANGSAEGTAPLPHSSTSTPKPLPPGQTLDLFTGKQINAEGNGDGNTSASVVIDQPKTDSEWEAYYNNKYQQLQHHPLQFPVVIKPLSGAGSNFVRKATNWGELLQVMALFVKQCKHVDSSGAFNESVLSSHPDLSSIVNPADADEQEIELLRAKWRHWGLHDVNASFMIEEQIIGYEIDLDVIIQDGQVKTVIMNDNYPTAGHTEYFMEAGGLVASVQPFKHQLGCRVILSLLVKYFSEYFLTSEHVYEPNEHRKEPITRKVNGIWHFEGMIATNMNWALQYDYGVMAGYTGDDDLQQGESYVCMPIEVNQRKGGSEVACLTTAISGIDFIAEHVKIACGIEIPSYYSLLPQYTPLNRLGYEWFPDGPLFDPTSIAPESIPDTPDSPTPHPQSVGNTQCGADDASHVSKIDPQLAALPYHPYISLPREKYVFPFHPAISPPHTLEHIYPALHTKLPCPESLSPRAELMPFQSAVELAHKYTNLLGIQTPHYAYAPGADYVHRFKFASSINFVPPYGGVVDVLHLPNEVLQDPYHLGSTMWYREGHHQTCKIPPDGFDFLGWLVAAGDSPREAQEQLFRLSSMLQWRINQ